jgi:preprotein translocase subunit SecG
MKSLLVATSIISAILLVVIILLQNQGSGLGTAFGGESGFYRTKRGAERVLFVLTIVLAVVFVGSLIAMLVVQ